MVIARFRGSFLIATTLDGRECPLRDKLSENGRGRGKAKHLYVTGRNTSFLGTQVAVKIRHT